MTGHRQSATLEPGLIYDKMVLQILVDAAKTYV